MSDYDKFTLVHQGGHHNVYCDGVRHIKTDGGFCHEDVDKGRSIRIAVLWMQAKGYNAYFDCDCQVYANGGPYRAK